MQQIEIEKLPSGLRTVCRHIPNAMVEYCGVVVKAGSRDDDPDSPGMAHFVEHTIFKGTAKRSSGHIINRMERVGGELNAYTSKEETVVYTAAPSGNAERAIELIADLVAFSRFPDAELNKEREVVADEIDSYLDTPSDAVYDIFEETIFAGTPLAHNILGDEKALATFDSQKCQRYLHRWYSAPNMVVFYMGAQSPDKIFKLVAKHFAMLPVDEPVRNNCDLAQLPSSFDLARTHDGLHQSHTVMGARIGGIYADDRFAVALLTNILGGPGMNSLLNVALREKRGLVYSVEASSSLLTDIGLFTIYYGCDKDDSKRCRALINSQVARLADKPVSAPALAAAKKQYLGQLAVASDNRENVAINLGRSTMYYNHVSSPAEVAERITAVTADGLRQAAESVAALSSFSLI